MDNPRFSAPPSDVRRAGRSQKTRSGSFKFSNTAYLNEQHYSDNEGDKSTYRKNHHYESVSVTNRNRSQEGSGRFHRNPGRKPTALSKSSEQTHDPNAEEQSTQVNEVLN